MALFTILGARGFIGSALARHLRAQGHDVLTCDPASLPDGTAGHLIYAIGLTADFRNRPFETTEAHVGLLNTVLRSCKFESFLYLSSTRVYQESDAALETVKLHVSPIDPDHLYNATKIAGESIVLNCGRAACRVVRLSNVLGPNEASRDTFVGALTREALSGSIHLRSNPASSKDYIWIEDVVSCIPAICMNGRERIYNLASGIQISHAEWVRLLCQYIGCNSRADDNAPLLSFPPIDIARISLEFGCSFRDPRDFVGDITRRSLVNEG